MLASKFSGLTVVACQLEAVAPIGAAPVRAARVGGPDGG